MAQETIFHRKGELNSGWSFWENYRPAAREEKGKKQENRFDENLGVLFTFNNQNTFAQFWNGAPYDQASNQIYYTLNELLINLFSD